MLCGRIRESKTDFFDWILLGDPSYRQSSRFICFVLFLEAVGVRGFCSRAAESRLEALRFVRSPRAARASHATNPRPSGLVALDLAECRQSYVRDVALSRKTPKLQQA